MLLQNNAHMACMCPHLSLSRRIRGSAMHAQLVVGPRPCTRMLPSDQNARDTWPAPPSGPPHHSAVQIIEKNGGNNESTPSLGISAVRFGPYIVIFHSV